jgi:hypothetical protein
MLNYHVYFFKNPVEKMNDIILLCCKKTHITHWDNLEETLLAYLYLQHFFVKTLWKNQETDIYLFAHYLIKNLSIGNSCKTHEAKEYNMMYFTRISYRVLHINLTNL